MKKEVMYRWSLKVENVYNFWGFHGEGYSASTLASHKNEVSGFVKKSNFQKLAVALVSFGNPVKEKKLKLITVEEYRKNWDKYR